GGGHEAGLAFSDIKTAFWRPLDEFGKGLTVLREDVQPDKLSAGIFEARERRATTIRNHREGHPENDYDVILIAKMEAKTPQFNLRNVGRVTRDVEVGWIEWGRVEMPDRHGYEADLIEVRTTRHQPVVPDQSAWAGTASREVRESNDVVFWENDWEQWYGDDKRREVGSLWRYRPEGDGKRTRPWPKIRITEHKYWKGRLITEEY
ncbi:MAG: hypothetical protein ACI9OJ_002986, partial [Myxococcota bacterium]